MKSTSAKTTSKPTSDTLSAGQVSALVSGTHADPFAVLGLHEASGGGLIARCFMPHAETVTAFTLATARQPATWPGGTRTGFSKAR